MMEKNSDFLEQLFVDKIPDPWTRAMILGILRRSAESVDVETWTKICALAGREAWLAIGYREPPPSSLPISGSGYLV